MHHLKNASMSLALTIDFFSYVNRDTILVSSGPKTNDVFLDVIGYPLNNLNILFLH